MKIHSKNPIVGVVIGAGLVCAIAFSLGFQASAEKVGTVDTQAVVTTSKKGVATRKLIDDKGTQLNDTLTFLKNNETMSPDQAKSMVDKVSKPVLSDNEKQELENIKAAVNADTKAYNDLIPKQSPTEGERAKIQKWSDNRAAMSTYLQLAGKSMDAFYRDWGQQQTKALLDATRQAIKDVAVKRGYTMILDSNAVIYSANDKTNDISEDVIKALDK